MQCIPEYCYCSNRGIADRNSISIHFQYCTHHRPLSHYVLTTVLLKRCFFSNKYLKWSYSLLRKKKVLQRKYDQLSTIVNILHSDAIGRPDNPQCSNFSVFNDEASIDFPKLIAFDSDNGVPRVTSI